LDIVPPFFEIENSQRRPPNDPGSHAFDEPSRASLRGFSGAATGGALAGAAGGAALARGAATGAALRGLFADS
jgi:hypothetical protein